ncbi:hypothetical protein ACUIJN_07450 [Metabacillus halosaccharovorans]
MSKKLIISTKMVENHKAKVIQKVNWILIQYGLNNGFFDL